MVSEKKTNLFPKNHVDYVSSKTKLLASIAQTDGDKKTITLDTKNNLQEPQ